MSKILVAFDTIEQAQAALHAVYGQQAQAPAPHFAPNTTTQYPDPNTTTQYPDPNVAQAPYTPPAGVPSAPAPQYAQQPAPAPQQQFAQPPAQQPYTPPAPPAPPQSAPAPQGDAGGITAQQVGAAAQAYAAKHGPMAAKAVFQQFGATAIKDIKPSDYPAALQALAV